MTTPPIGERRSLWIPWVFAGCMLLVVVVNGVLVWASVSTFTGVTVPRSYERGRGYDQVLAEAARQDALGWTVELRLDDGLLRVTARDREGRPLVGRLEGVLLRPLERLEIPLQLRATGVGLWQAEFHPPRPGQWEARLTLWGAGGEPFDIRQRVFVP